MNKVLYGEILMPGSNEEQADQQQKIKNGFWKTVKKSAGRIPFIEDVVAGAKIKVHYQPKYNWAYVSDPAGKITNRAYSYIFALKQHLPDIKVYSKVDKDP